MCPNDPSKKRKLWELCKKSLSTIISIVSGIIISSITAYIILITGAPRAKLMATVDYGSWIAPRDVTSDLMSIDEARTQFKKKDSDYHLELKKDHNDIEATWVILGHKSNYSAPDMNDVVSMCFITISNKGGAPAKKVKMYFPHAIHVEFLRGGIPEKEVKDSNGKIFYILDKNLAQEDEVEVRIWAHCEPERECINKLSIACERDTASIGVLTPVRGFAQHMSDHPVRTIFFIVIIWFVIHAGVWLKYKKKKIGS